MRADLSRATRSLMTPTLELDAFSGEAKGIAHLGEAGPKVAAVLEDARQRKQEFQDAVSLALYDKRMREAYARYKESLPGQPESAYLAGWQKAQAQEREAALKDIAVSERGRAGLSRYDADFSRRTAGEMVTLASHTAVERGTGEILAQAHRSFARGHDEDAYAISERLVELGAFTREQSDAQIAAWKETRRMEFLTSAMERLPREFAQELRSMVQTGKSEPLQDAVRNPEEARQWLNKAERHWRETQSATRQEVFGSIVAQSSPGRTRSSPQAGGTLMKRTSRPRGRRWETTAGLWTTPPTADCAWPPSPTMPRQMRMAPASPPSTAKSSPMCAETKPPFCSSRPASQPAPTAAALPVFPRRWRAMRAPDVWARPAATPRAASSIRKRRN